MFQRAVLVLAVMLVSCARVLAAPAVDFTKITLNHVTLGQTSGLAEHYLGIQHKNTGNTIEFRDRSPLGRYTVDVVKNKVVAVRNMSELQFSGKTVLRSNEPASKIATVLDNAIPHVTKTKAGTTTTVYTQSGRALTVVVQNNTIQGFALAPAK